MTAGGRFPPGTMHRPRYPRVSVGLAEESDWSHRRRQVRDEVKVWHARHVGRRDFRSLGQFGDHGEIARLEHGFPAEGAGHSPQ